MEANKANYSDEAFTLFKRYTNIERIFYTRFRNITTSDLNGNNWGLVSDDLTPKKALSYYQAANGAVSDFTAQHNYPTTAPNLLPLVCVENSGSPVYDNGNMRILAGSRMYMNINDNWLDDTNGGIDTTAYIDVSYLDAGTTQWHLEYDGTSDVNTQSSNEQLTNSGTWKTKTFTLNDIKFANRQNNSCDFNIFAVDGPMVVRSVIVRKVNNRGVYITGSADKFSLLTRPDSTIVGAETYNPVCTIGGRECRQLLDIANYMYFAVAKGVAKSGDKDLKIGITYYDIGTDPLGIQYSSTSDAYKIYSFNKTNTLTWKYKEIILKDADFSGKQNNGCDFRICNPWVQSNNNPEYISKVEVIRQ